jgi:hypothetical protein
LTSAVSRMTERYKRLVRVNQSYLLSHKYVNKVSMFLDLHLFVMLHRNMSYIL